MQGFKSKAFPGGQRYPEGAPRWKPV